MNEILDFHTHCPVATSALISVDPREFDPRSGLCYSVGFHPWHGIDRLTDEDYELLDRCARHPQVLAIGETGMDHLRGAPLDCQREAFVRHLRLASLLGKPVVVHCVRAAQDILSARHQVALDSVPLVIHGMRAGERVARVLLDAGCYLSFGEHFNEASVRLTPLDRMLLETDESPVDISSIAAAVARALDLPPEQLVAQVTANARKLLY